MTKPVRLQLSRRKGFSLQALSMATNGLPAVKVTRPGLWGNPFPVKEAEEYFSHTGEIGDAAAKSVSWYRTWLTEQISGGRYMPPTLRMVREKLAGKNLACFCKIGQPCHGDVLLELSNAE